MAGAARRAPVFLGPARLLLRQDDRGERRDGHGVFQAARQPLMNTNEHE